MKELKETTSTENHRGRFTVHFSPLLLVISLMVVILFSGKTEISANAGTLNQHLTQAAPRPNISPFFTEEVQYWSDEIDKWSKSFGLDPNLVATVMQIESCGHPEVGSSAGAMGLFQVMPYHFAEGENALHPDTNARRGLAYLAKAFESYGTVRLALASYNGGITTASWPESEWPDETVRYVYWGEQIYWDAYSGKDASNRLNEWLQAGGASLCERARQNLQLN